MRIVVDEEETDNRSDAPTGRRYGVAGPAGDIMQAWAGRIAGPLL